MWTTDLFDLVFGDLQLDFWQIMNLPSLHHPPCHLLQGCSTLLAASRTVRDNRVRLGHHRQRHPRVANLSATFLATWLALAAGFASEPITGRWFTAVVTIFGQPPF